MACCCPCRRSFQTLPGSKSSSGCLATARNMSRCVEKAGWCGMKPGGRAGSESQSHSTSRSAKSPMPLRPRSPPINHILRRRAPATRKYDNVTCTYETSSRNFHLGLGFPRWNNLPGIWMGLQSLGLPSFNRSLQMIRQLCFGLLVLSLCSFVGCGGGSGSSTPESSTPGGGTPPPVLPPGATFFALDIGNLNEPWPTALGVQFGIWRSLGAELRWNQIETCQPADETNANDPCYDWSKFDQWMPLATANGQKILYTAFYTPTWASSNP